MRVSAAVVLLLFLLSSTVLFVHSQKDDVASLLVQFGDDVASPVRESLLDALRHIIAPALKSLVVVVPPSSTLDISTVLPGSVAVSFGKASKAMEMIPDSELQSKIKPEGYILRGTCGKTTAGVTVPIYAARGLPGVYNLLGSEELSVPDNNNGLSYAIYDMMQKHMGLSWIHPLQGPEIAPAKLTHIHDACQDWEEIESGPAYEFRSWHYHTQHPLEMTNLLQGFGQKMNTTQDSWLEEVWMWDRFMEWLLILRQNRVQWVLLQGEDWKDFSTSATRMSRLQQLTATAHTWGIMTAVDVPIAFEQQNSFRLINKFGNLDDEIKQIGQSLDWIMQANFDYLATELGFSEFTHPDAEKMLAWLNATVDYLAQKFQRKLYAKVHCSAGQVAKPYIDPRTGQYINFNFLPHFADPRLAVQVHTVQVYDLQDPAPVYGNQNFTYLLDFMVWESQFRDVVWYPETAYWVNYDINVPLGLPLYGERRVRDMQIIQQAFQNLNRNIKGQVVFTSGLEWLYPFSGYMAAAAVWNPSVTAQSLVSEYTKFFSVDPNIQAEVTKFIMDFTQVQADTLIYGKVNGTAPDNIVMHNGMAYIVGWDTWAQFNELVSFLPEFKSGGEQPYRIPLESLSGDDANENLYWNSVDPLLESMVTQFNTLLGRAANLLPVVEQSMGRDLLQEWLDVLGMTALRSQQVLALYRYAAGKRTRGQDWLNTQLQLACKATETAEETLARVESSYAVDVESVSSWGQNPTVYTYKFLWTAHTLYYWTRDFALALDQPISPCIMNIQNPYEVGFGEGYAENMLEDLREILEKFKAFDWFAECLAGPKTDPGWTYKKYCPASSQ